MIGLGLIEAIPVADIVADPHYQARDMILPTALPGGTAVKMPGIVPKLSATPGTVRASAPHVGDDTDSVLRGGQYDRFVFSPL